MAVVGTGGQFEGWQERGEKKSLTGMQMRFILIM